MPESTISKFSYATDTVGSIQKILHAWAVEDLEDRRRSIPKTEKGWERSLVDHMRLMLPELNIIPQGGSGMKHGDIVVERKGYLGGLVRDIVELKLGLSSTGNYQRLIGQVEDYRKESGTTIVVICGSDVDLKLMKALQTRYPSSTEKLGVFWKKDAKKGVTQLFPEPSKGSTLMFRALK
jgi:hypothetical protein